MTREEFESATLPLAAGFPFPMAPAWLKLLWQSVKHLDALHFTAAVNRAVLTHEHPSHPPIATLLRYADEAAHGVEMTADQAVDLVWRAVRKHGTFSTDDIRAAQDELGPKITAAMKAAGGYMRFADCSSGDKGTLIAQFREAWNANVRREEQTRRLPAALLPRANGPTHHQALTNATETKLIAQGANP